MLLPRGSIANPVSDKTTAGEPASYACYIGCGIGVAAAIGAGSVLILGIWCWYWLRKPLCRSPADLEVEKSRLEFLTRKPSQQKSWVKRASTAIITPIGPAVLKRLTFTDGLKDNFDGRTRLIKHMAPINNFEQYRPSTAPATGSFPQPHEWTVPPRTVRPQRSAPQIRNAHRDLFVNCPAERLQRAPWTDGAFFVHNSCQGRRLQRKQPE